MKRLELIYRPIVVHKNRQLKGKWKVEVARPLVGCMSNEVYRMYLKEAKDRNRVAFMKSWLN